MERTLFDALVSCLVSEEWDFDDIVGSTESLLGRDLTVTELTQIQAAYDDPA